MPEKSEKLAVGLTEAEKQQFRVEAAKAGKSMSELAREILLAEVLDQDADDEGNQKRPAATAD
jgi:plasmid stability protein